MKKKSILITNDDGFESLGLRALIDALKPLAHITVVAPAAEKSACGHSLTLTRPLRFIEIDDDFFRLDDGTPSDCVYLALNALFDERRKPDLIVSGINKGSNMGEDITYSGTVAGAMEGALQGVASIAISQVCKNGCNGFDLNFDLAAKTAYDLVKKVFEGHFPLGERKLLNVNIPPLKIDECKGYKITKAGYRLYANDAQLHRNPRGEEHYWLGTHPLEWVPNAQKTCDFEAINDGYISITPIKLDLTSYEDIENIKKWIEG